MPTNVGRMSPSANILPDEDCHPCRGDLEAYGTPPQRSYMGTLRRWACHSVLSITRPAGGRPPSLSITRPQGPAGTHLCPSPDHRDQQACTQAPSSHNSERQALSLFLLTKGETEAETPVLSLALPSQLTLDGRKEMEAAVGSHRLPLRASKRHRCEP